MRLNGYVSLVRGDKESIARMMAACEAWLRRVEPAPAGLVAEPPEHGRDRLHVPVSERADDDRGAVRKVEGAGFHG